ncbi:hypothetical protein NKH77_53705 [Streptomyces sp. M19]
MFPFTLGSDHGHDGFLTTAQISTLTATTYGSNIAANLFFGVFGDRFGWRRTITFFGCVGCAIATRCGTSPRWPPRASPSPSRWAVCTGSCSPGSSRCRR